MVLLCSAVTRFLTSARSWPSILMVIGSFSLAPYLHALIKINSRVSNLVEPSSLDEYVTRYSLAVRSHQASEADIPRSIASSKSGYLERQSDKVVRDISSSFATAGKPSPTASIA